MHIIIVNYGFLECSQMTGVFYHSVIHGLGFFICFKIWILRAQNNKTRFFYVLFSDKTQAFDQSEHAQGPIYILMIINVHHMPGEVPQPYGYCSCFQLERSGFEPWLTTLHFVLWHGTLLSQCLRVSTLVYNCVQLNLMLGVSMRWTSIPARGIRNTSSCFVQLKLG